MNVDPPAPNPEDWASTAYVMRVCGVTVATVHRWSTGRYPDGRTGPIVLRRYTALDTSTPMFWRPEVDDLAAARRRTRGISHG